MATAVITRSRWTAEHLFYTGMACAMLLAVLIGFAPTYYLRGRMEPWQPVPVLPMTPLIHAHGLLFSSWILLFVAQTGLVAAGRTDVHRRLGLLGGVLAPAMVVVGTLTALHGSLRGVVPPGTSPLAFLAVPLFDMLVFATLVGAALVLRRFPQTHKRLMLITMIGLMPPAIGRMPLPGIQSPLVFFGLPDLLLLPLVAWDFTTRGRPHWATVCGGLLIVGSQILRISIWQTEGWLRFARWALGLVA